MSVTIKQLEWETDHVGGGLRAGEYRLRPGLWTHGYYWLRGDDEPHTGYADEDDAKAAAQADYEARILTAIEPVAASPGVPDGGWVYLVYDWAWTDDTGQEHYARTPERAERLKAEGRKLTPVYTRERRSDLAPPSPEPSPASGDVLGAAWIEWEPTTDKARRPPMEPNDLVEVRYRSGLEDTGNACRFDWWISAEHGPSHYDIVAYRALSSKQRREKE